MIQPGPNPQYGIKYEAVLLWLLTQKKVTVVTTMLKNRLISRLSFSLIFSLIVHGIAIAQEEEVLRSADSLNTVTVVVDSTAPEGKKIKKVNVYNPRKAALRSAILPGWGQVYNKKYWKVPIVYGALGTSAAVFFFNLKTYKDTRFAYRVKYNMRVNGTDSALFDKIPDYLRILDEGSLRSHRDSYRRRQQGQPNSRERIRIAKAG